MRAIVATRAFKRDPDDESLPSDDELRDVLSRPEVQEVLDRYEEAKRQGTLRVHSNDEARAIVGLLPRSDDRP